MDVGDPGQSCQGCPFGGAKVGWKGRFDAPFVIVGESPGKTEVRNKMPFAGPSGEVLHNFIGSDDVFITNAMRCYPPTKKRPEKMTKAGQLCKGHLIEQITAHPRRIILALGNEAVRSLTGNQSLKITQIRGQVIPSDLAEVGILPAIHPAALLRGTGSYRQFREDLLYAKYIADGNDPKEYVNPVYETISTEEDFQRAYEHLLQFDKYASDLETSGFSCIEDYILNMGIEPIGYDAESPDGKRTGYVYVLDPQFIPRMAPLLEDMYRDWCWHNGKFDTQFLRELGILARTDSDTMLLNYALDESPGVHDLETASGDVLGAPDYKDMLKPYLPNKKTSYSVIPRPVLDKYLADDTHRTGELRTILRQRVKDDPVLEKLYTQVLLPASNMLADVERAGMHVRMDVLEANSEKYSRQLTDLRQQLCDIAKVEHNPNSPQQVQKLLYEKMKLPRKKGGGTAKEILEKLPQTPYVKALLKYRRVAKVYGTYVGTPFDPKTKGPKGLYKYIGSDGRVHPTFLIHGTATGRLSSRDPNLQNIPREAELRGQFGAPPGRRLIDVDFSQAELRSLACVSGDPDLIYIYANGLDLHTELAKFLFPGWEERNALGEAGDARMKAQAKEERVMAKTVNFGIVYGRTAFTIADAFDISVPEAQRLIDGWFKRFPVAHKFINKCRSAPSSGKIMTTAFGRRKRVGIVAPGNLRDLMNEAANFPHQSIASDITMQAAVEGRPKLYQYDTFIVNLVHDSIIVETPDDDTIVKDVSRELILTMESIAPKWGITRVPFEAEAEHGYQWGYTKKITREELGLSAAA